MRPCVHQSSNCMRFIITISYKPVDRNPPHFFVDVVEGTDDDFEGQRVKVALAMRHRLMPGFHHSVAVLPLPFRRCRYPLPFPYTVVVVVAVAYLFAVYGCNGTEFS